MIYFASPYALSLLFLPFLLHYILPPIKGLHGDALRIPFIDDLEKISIKSGSIWNVGKSAADYGLSKKFWFLFLVWFLLVLAAARPQKIGEPIRLQNDSRDIMLVLDISTSMLQPDFAFRGQRIDRLTAVKKTASDFIKKRANDRVGLILFGTRAYMQAPLTFDKNSVDEILWSMQAGMAGDSTSIGDALGLALKNLKDNKDIENKVIILLTDGENNDGSLSLAQAIKLAKDEGIKTYTIGVGSRDTFFGLLLGQARGVDEKGLSDLAKATDGEYFRAENTTSLQKIYNAIDQLEPSSQDEQFVRETKELYYIPLLIAIFLGMILAVKLRRIEG